MKNHKWAFFTLTPGCFTPNLKSRMDYSTVPGDEFPWVGCIWSIAWPLEWESWRICRNTVARERLINSWSQSFYVGSPLGGCLLFVGVCLSAFLYEDHCFLYGETPDTDPVRMITASSPSCHRIGASPRLHTRSVEVRGPEFCWIRCGFFSIWISTMGCGQTISQPNCQPPT